MRSPKPRGEVRFLGGLLDFEERLMRNGSTIAEMLVVLCVVLLGAVMFAPTEQTPFPWHCEVVV